MAGIVVRRFPEIVLLDVESISRAREREVKHELLQQRAGRIVNRVASQITAVIRPLIRLAIAGGSNAYDSVMALERKWRTVGAGATKLASTDERLRLLTEEAESLSRQGKAREAERKYIEAISVNPKYVKAYENLGRLYVREKQWIEAEESFQFVLKLDPNDASAHANLGELEAARGDLPSAVAHFKEAVARKPANPKYLDLLLEAAIITSDRDLARGTFARLKETNPENQKLDELKRSIEALEKSSNPSA